MSLILHPRYTKGEHYLSWILIILSCLLIITSFSFSICSKKSDKNKPTASPDFSDGGDIEPKIVKKIVLKHLGAISIKSENSYFFLCNAYRMKKSWFLTTAKCGKTSANAIIRTNIASWDSKSFDYEIIEYHNSENAEDGIVLLKVNNQRIERSAQYTESSELDFELKGVNFWTFGWVRKSDGANNCISVKKLKQISREVCMKSIEIPCNNNNICLLPVDNNQPCLPDEGAPLIYYNSLYGIKSWGESCGINQVQVYAEIGSYSDWMRNTTAVM